MHMRWIKMSRRALTKVQAVVLAVIVIIVVAVGGYYAWLTTRPPPKEVIKIGVPLPLTGPAAETGLAMKRGAILAMEQVNEKGGIYVKELGRRLKVELVFADTQSKPEVGVSVAEMLITKEKVDFICGHLHSSVTLAAMEVYAKYGILAISMQPVSSAISKKVLENPEKYKYFFKCDVNGSAYGIAFASFTKYIIEKGLFKPKTKTIALILEDTDYGRTVSEAVAKEFEKIGFKVVAKHVVPVGETDFYPVLADIAEKKPDMVWSILTSLASGVALTKQFKEAKVKAVFYGNYYPVKAEYIPQCGEAAEYVTWCSSMALIPGHPPSEQFIRDYEKRWPGEKATADAAYGYAPLMMLFEAIEKAGTLDKDKIAETLLTMEYVGPLGKFVFGKDNHEVLPGPEYMPQLMYQIVGGKNVVVWPEWCKQAEWKVPPWL